MVTNGAPLTLKIRGYQEPDRSIIRMTFRNISFNGITADPHFLLENVNEIHDEDIYVNGIPWKISSGVAIVEPTLVLLVVSVVQYFY